MDTTLIKEQSYWLTYWVNFKVNNVQPKNRVPIEEFEQAVGKTKLHDILAGKRNIDRQVVAVMKERFNLMVDVPLEKIRFVKFVEYLTDNPFNGSRHFKANIAQNLGMSNQALNDILHEDNNIAGYYMPKLVEIYGADCNYFFNVDHSNMFYESASVKAVTCSDLAELYAVDKIVIDVSSHKRA